MMLTVALSKGLGLLTALILYVFQRFLLPPILQQFWSRKTGTVHPEFFPSNQILLLGPLTLLLYIFFLHDLPFPTLLLVNNYHSRGRLLLRPCISALLFLVLVVRFWFTLTARRRGKEKVGGTSEVLNSFAGVLAPAPDLAPILISSSEVVGDE